jgi:hypothetical protein
MTKPLFYSAIVTTLAAVSLACVGGSSDPVALGEPDVSVPVDVPAEPEVQPTPAPIPEPILLTDDGTGGIGRLAPSAYSNAWLVIAASTPTLEPIPLNVVAAEQQSGGLLAADRLDSGQFKGLMPCWSIAIAGASAERSAAVEMLELLKAQGVDGYIKNAGEYVGDDPRVQAVCEDMRSDSMNECPADAYMTQVIDGRWHLQVSVPAEVADLAMSGAPSPQSADADKTVWTSPLRVETIGDVGVGDTFFIDELSGTHTVGECTVTGFSAVTQGIPHFSYSEFGDAETPGCGSPAPWAILDCGTVDYEGLGVATTRAVTAESWRPAPAPLGAQSSEAGDAVAIALAHSEFRSAKSGAQALADEQGEVLNEDIVVVNYTTPAGDGFAITTKWWTREGFAFCGGDDVLVSRTVGVVGGEVRTDVADTTYTNFHGVVEFGAEPTAQVVTKAMLGGVSVGQGGAECGITIDFCDCGC